MTPEHDPRASGDLSRTAIASLAVALERYKHPKDLLIQAVDDGVLERDCLRAADLDGKSEQLARRWWEDLHTLRNGKHHCIAAILWSHYKRHLAGAVAYPGGLDALLQALEDQAGQGGELPPLEAGARDPDPARHIHWVTQSSAAMATQGASCSPHGSQFDPDLKAPTLDPPADSPGPAEAPERPRHANPYRYLDYFDIGDRLYGRDGETRALVELVQGRLGHPSGRCLVGVTGSSGCGKSSLLRAGLLTELLGQGHGVAAVRPTDFHNDQGMPEDVVRKLVHRLAAAEHAGLRLSGKDHLALDTAQPRRLPGLAVELIEAALAGAGAGDRPGDRTSGETAAPRRLVIALDQLEEAIDDLAARGKDSPWQGLVRFLGLAHASPRIGLVYTLESSREPLVGQTTLGPLLGQCPEDRIAIDGFARLFLSQIIEQPLRELPGPMPDRAVIRRLFANAEALRTQTRHQEADSLLPLVALTLSRLFDWIAEKDWKAAELADGGTGGPVGGLGGGRPLIGLDRIEQRLLDPCRAIEETAKAAWGERDTDEALDHFLRPLVGLADPAGDRLVLRQVPLHPFHAERIAAESFLAGRLLAREGERVRLVHEAVVRFWPAAADWLAEHRGRLLVERGQRESALAWDSAGRRPIEDATEGQIDDAADTLGAYLRSWCYLDAEDLGTEDRLLRDHCLALLGRSRTPGRRVRMSVKSGACHVHLAADYGLVGLLEAFRALDPGCLDRPSADGRTPMAYAAWTSAPAVEYLLDSGANPITRDQAGWPPIVTAIQSGDLPIFELLIGRYRREQLEGWPGGQTALHLLGALVKPGERTAELLAMARSLIGGHGLDPDARDDRGWTPLLRAAFRGHAGLVDWLIGRADINATTKDGWTALHLAALEGHTAVMHRLLEDHGFTGLDARTEDGRHALHIAVASQRVEAVRLLLAEPVDPDVEDKLAQTPLHRACQPLQRWWGSSDDQRRRAREMIRLLLDHTDPNRSSIFVGSVLAMVEGDPQASRMILHSPRLDPDRAIRSGGPAPLLLAAEDEDWDLVRSMLVRSKGGAFETSNAKGDGLLHLLIDKGAPDDLILAAFEAAPSKAPETRGGETPLMRAIDGRDPGLVRRLIALGGGCRPLDRRTGHAPDGGHPIRRRPDPARPPLGRQPGGTGDQDGAGLDGPAHRLRQAGRLGHGVVACADGRCALGSGRRLGPPADGPGPTGCRRLVRARGIFLELGQRAPVAGPARRCPGRLAAVPGRGGPPLSDRTRHPDRADDTSLLRPRAGPAPASE